MNHLERAKREEASPLIEAGYQQRLVEEKILHEREQQLEVELSWECHDSDLQEKNRLARMLDNKRIFQQQVTSRREAEHDRLKRGRDERIGHIVQERRQERLVRRKMICFLRSEQERLNKIREEEEAREREEVDRKRNEEAQRRAKLDEIAQKQRLRELELDEKERLRKEQLQTPSARPPSEASAHAEPPKVNAAAAAPSPAKYVPRFRKEQGSSGAGGGQVAPSTDRWQSDEVNLLVLGTVAPGLPGHHPVFLHATDFDFAKSFAV